jgi:multicomponent Na+:H+ antiporter subunit E
MIRVDLRSDSDLYQTLTTELVSLVPGSLVVEARRSTRTLYLHVLDVDTPAELPPARDSVLDAEARVIEAYGSAEDRERLRR